LAAVSFVACKGCAGLFAYFEFGDIFKTLARVISLQFVRAAVTSLQSIMSVRLSWQVFVRSAAWQWVY